MMKQFKWIIFGVFFLYSAKALAQDTLKVKDVEAILYKGSGKAMPLIVGLGGSEGGNAWASDYWKPTRDQFINEGYAFLALGYFGAKNTPTILNKIEIESIYSAISLASKQQGVQTNRIAIIGGSRGGDLALLLASYYPEIKAVVTLVASHAVFPGHTQTFDSSCWMFKGKELPFVPVNDAAVPFLIKGDLRATFEAMLLDTVAEAKALIPVERIKAPILLISATNDEICPSTPMAEKLMTRLKSFNHPYFYQHTPIVGKHAEALKHFNLVFDFLSKNFKD